MLILKCVKQAQLEWHLSSVNVIQNKKNSNIAMLNTERPFATAIVLQTKGWRVQNQGMEF